MRALLALLLLAAPPAAADPFIIVQSTTSTAHSGLFEAILPASARPPASRPAWSRWAPGRR